MNYESTPSRNHHHYHRHPHDHHQGSPGAEERRQPPGHTVTSIHPGHAAVKQVGRDRVVVSDHLQWQTIRLSPHGEWMFFTQVSSNHLASSLVVQLEPSKPHLQTRDLITLNTCTVLSVQCSAVQCTCKVYSVDSEIFHHDSYAYGAYT